MPKERYNLLIICPDQLRADCLGCYGHPTVGTAHIDRLASGGVRFDKCYCAAPLCGPSRISFATSTYLSEHGHRDYAATIDPKVPNLVSCLKAAGYRTGMFGKNHLFTPDRLREVWDELDEVCLGNYDDHPMYKHAFSAFPMETKHPYNITARLTDETLAFMHRTTQPFLAWVNYQDPHPAYTCPEPYCRLFNPRKVALPVSWNQPSVGPKPVRNKVWKAHAQMDLCGDAEMRAAIAMYLGQVRYVDDSVGRLLDCLARTYLEKNTIVLFLADHGELLGDHGMVHKLPAFYESLARIPVILRHPKGLWKGTTFRGLAEEVDLAPTLLEALALPVPPTMAGRSWLAALNAGDDRGRETALCEAGGGAPTPRAPVEKLKLRAPDAPTSFGPGAMLRKGPWKLSVYHDDQGELYNLDNDPHEMVNLFDHPAHQAVRNDLAVELARRLLGVKVRDVGLRWPRDRYPIDVRFEPLE